MSKLKVKVVSSNFVACQCKEDSQQKQKQRQKQKAKAKAEGKAKSKSKQQKQMQKPKAEAKAEAKSTSRSKSKSKKQKLKGQNNAKNIPGKHLKTSQKNRGSFVTSVSPLLVSSRLRRFLRRRGGVRPSGSSSVSSFKSSTIPGSCARQCARKNTRNPWNSETE